MPRVSRVNLGLLAVIAVALVLLALREESGPGIEVVRREAPGQLDQVVVHVSGAVAEPGTYTLEPGDRVADAVALAGGLTAAADEAGVNLALRVRDEDQIYVPRVGEASALLDLNTATSAELEELPGIGPVYAGRVIEAREVGVFGSVDELVERDVIPAHVYEGIRSLVTVVSR
jgi:competence protein ComEA